MFLRHFFFFGLPVVNGPPGSKFEPSRSISSMYTITSSKSTVEAVVSDSSSQLWC